MMLNKKHSLVLLAFFCFFVSLHSEEWKKPQGVSEGVWKKVLPYVMPKNHPIREQLDALFSSRRVLANPHSIRDAGFSHGNSRKHSHVIVTEHKKMRGYYFKMYSDTQHGVSDWQHCLRRLTGAESVRKAIEKFHYEKFFVVPKKWIYPLPDYPKAAKGANAQHFIVVAEKLKLHHGPENLSRWKYDISKEHMTALYKLFQNQGLKDSVYPFNARFTKKKRIALIDLEKHHQWPVPFEKLYVHISPENKKLLDNLMNSQR